MRFFASSSYGARYSSCSDCKYFISCSMKFKCLLTLPLLAVSLQAASVADLFFALNGDGTEYSVSGFEQYASGSLDIPSTYNGLPVTSIRWNAFESSPNLTSVTIPDSVTSIGNNAFYFCTSLTSIAIPDSVTSIGDWAFEGCTSLISITIPDSVTSIGHSTFKACSGLTSITIPDIVTSIEGAAFEGCSGLTSITIPDSVTSIGNNAFYFCTSLTSITIPDSVTSIGDYWAFSDSGLLSITFEGDAPNVGGWVFPNAVIYYYDDATGFTSPTWQGIQSEVISRPAPIIAGIEKLEVGVNLWFNSASGQSYRIESSNDLESWTSLEDEIISEGDTVIRYYDTVGIQKRFYRVKRND